MFDEMPDLSSPVPLFPLPNVVLLPGVTLPLQIFEPRYRAMVRDTLKGDRLIAMALLEPGFEPYYHTHIAPIHPVVCVGRIRDQVKLPDGRYLINLVGVCPALVKYEEQEGDYRCAFLEALPRDGGGIDADGEAIRRLVETDALDAVDGIATCRKTLSKSVSLDDLIDVVAGRLLPTEAVEVRQRLLAETNPLERASTLIGELRTLLKSIEINSKQRNDWPRFGSMN